MLVKLAFVMQRLKKYLKNFCHDRQRWGGDNFWILWGGDSCYKGGHIAHGGFPSPPPTRENPGKIFTQSIFLQKMKVLICVNN